MGGAATCVAGETRACYDGPAGTRNVGLCKAGKQTCSASAGVGTWDPECKGEVVPAKDEVCASDQSQDANCDGVVCGQSVFVLGVGGLGQDSIESVAIDSKGAIVFAGVAEALVLDGHALAPPAGQSMIYAAKLTAKGTVDWVKMLGTGTVTDPNQDEIGIHVAVDGSDRVFVAGHVRDKIDLGGVTAAMTSGTTSPLAFVGELDKSSGAGVWAAALSDSQDSRVDALAVGADGVHVAGFACCGTLSTGAANANLGSTGGFVAHYTLDGAALLIIQLSSSATVHPATAVALSTGGVAVAGRYTGTYTWPGGTLANVAALGDTDAFLALVDLNGEPFAASFGTTKPDALEGLARRADGRLFATGYTSDGVTIGATTLKGHGDTDILLLAAGSKGEAPEGWILGDTKAQRGRAVAVDEAGRLYVGADDAGGGVITFAGVKLAGEGLVLAFDENHGERWGRALAGDVRAIAAGHGKVVAVGAYNATLDAGAKGEITTNGAHDGFLVVFAP